MSVVRSLHFLPHYVSAHSISHVLYVSAGSFGTSVGMSYASQRVITDTNPSGLYSAESSTKYFFSFSSSVLCHDKQRTDTTVMMDPFLPAPTCHPNAIRDVPCPYSRPIRRLLGFRVASPTLPFSSHSSLHSATRCMNRHKRTCLLLQLDLFHINTDATIRIFIYS